MNCFICVAYMNDFMYLIMRFMMIMIVQFAENRVIVTILGRDVAFLGGDFVFLGEDVAILGGDVAFLGGDFAFL